jgi:hypothetical protein
MLNKKYEEIWLQLNPMTVINCKTKEDAKEWLQFCHEKGIKWKTKESLLKTICFKQNKSATCYHIVNGYMQFANKEFYVEEGYRILEF